MPELCIKKLCIIVVRGIKIKSFKRSVFVSAITMVAINIIVTVFFLAPVTLLAAPPTSADKQIIQQEAEKILQQEKLRDEEMLKKHDLRRRPPTNIELDIQKEEVPGKPSKQCFEINKIILDGAHSLSEEEKQNLISPFQGKCIGLTEIKELLRKITNYYIDKGYVSTRAYIPQQDLNDGTLEILIIEGVTESIELDSN
ncbi:MAG: hypothetical protein OEX83_06365, partial [Gammaproteobacteria bacterium]|nr:hypothetical protein [Gammaproteobacteria bacterium]